MGDTVLALVGLRKRYGAHVAVRDLDLTLERGEFMTFLGPSGSGKTTTLMMIAGLQQPDAGRIVLNGEAVDRLPPYRRDLGMVFQNYALFPHMSVARNLAFPLEARGVANAEIRRLVADALQLVSLPEHGGRLPRELSGGQQQRVALARAMIYSPALLLMDEPLGALDKKLREQLQGEIVRVHRERGTTVLYVTHDQSEALTMSDRIAVFNEGGIEQVGTPVELYERPATRFVASFIGETNFLPGRLIGGAGEVEICGQRLRAANPQKIVAGSAVTLAVRPERVVLGGSENGLAATLVSVVYLGNARRYVLRLAGGEECTALVQVGDAPLPNVQPGAAVTVSFRPEYATLFG